MGLGVGHWCRPFPWTLASNNWTALDRLLPYTPAFIKQALEFDQILSASPTPNTDSNMFEGRERTSWKWWWRVTKVSPSPATLPWPQSFSNSTPVQTFQLWERWRNNLGRAQQCRNRKKILCGRARAKSLSLLQCPLLAAGPRPICYCPGCGGTLGRTELVLP